jgi:hypothetical protein
MRYRDLWKEKIEFAKTLRHFDLESNRVSTATMSQSRAETPQIFATHAIAPPPSLQGSVVAADSFSWLQRETIAVATARSVHIGWRRDSQCEFIPERGLISSVP